ncbi:MAG: hypothetical protein ACI35Q_10630 [Marinilabiliaceae bacterium]
MGHYASFNVRNALFSSLPEVWRDGEFDERLPIWVPYRRQMWKSGGAKGDAGK